MTVRLSITSSVAALIVALGTVSLATGASAPPWGAPPSRESWADTTHGWRVIGRSNMFGGYPAVQATENGGRSWHTIRRQPRYGISEIQRTTSTDGIAFLPRPRKPVLVTTDNGRHWKALPLVPRGSRIEASGRDIFWLSYEGTSLRRLNRMRNALLGRTRTSVVASLPQDSIFEGLQPVPGGVAAVASGVDRLDPDDSLLSLVVYRYGRVRISTIVRGSTLRVCPASEQSFSIEWPVITIVTWEVSPDPGPLGGCTGASRTISFVSTDGGETWIEPDG